MLEPGKPNVSITHQVKEKFNLTMGFEIPDCSERQCIKDMDGVAKRPKIRSCCISDPFILIIREDDSLGLFVGDAERGRIRRKDMTPMGEKVCTTLV